MRGSLLVADLLQTSVNSSLLQALHKERLADSDHTTLLLNCYTKLKDVNQLDKFINRDVDFDVETAIRVCHSFMAIESHSTESFLNNLGLWCKVVFLSLISPSISPSGMSAGVILQARVGLGRET